MSFYVRRTKSDGSTAYVGPIRSARQADKERAAWESVGQPSEVLPSSPAVRADVRAWQKQVAAAIGG